jgi:hypothetical protein
MNNPYYAYAPSSQAGSTNQPSANGALAIHGFTVGGVLTVLGLAVLTVLVLNLLNFRFSLAVRR